MNQLCQNGVLQMTGLLRVKRQHVTQGCSINYSDGGMDGKIFPVGGAVFLKCFPEGEEKTNLCFPVGGRVSH